MATKPRAHLTVSVVVISEEALKSEAVLQFGPVIGQEKLYSLIMQAQYYTHEAIINKCILFGLRYLLAHIRCF